MLLQIDYAGMKKTDHLDTLNDVHLTLEPFKKSNSSIFLAPTLRIRANESKLYEWWSS